MNRVWRATLQALTFMRKEINDAFHQPRLLLALVLGPFAIMAVFALGYHNAAPPLRTFVVVPKGSPLEQQAKSYADALGGYVKLRGVGSDYNKARRDLEQGRVDVVVAFPKDPMADLMEGQHSKITILHTRLDPIEQTAIDFASQLAVDRFNGAVVANAISKGQQAAAPVNDSLDAASAAVKALDTAVQSGDENAANAALDQLDRATPALTTSARDLSALLSQVSSQDGGSSRADELSKSLDQWAASLQTAHQQGKNVDPETIHALDQSLSGLRTSVQDFSNVDANLLAQPFEPDVHLAVPEVHQMTDWYAPAAIVVILQQFGLAFGALTFVRERQLAIADVLKVAPVSAGPSLVGRYLAYLILGGIIAAALTALTVVVLNVPLVGGIVVTAVVMGLTLLASIGLGFVISLASASDAQAVQYALLVLLASLFFSGFFLGIGQLHGPARVVGWLLPATYGMQMLRDVMLRGANPQPYLTLGLAAYAVVMFLFSLAGSRRRINAGRP